MRDSQHESRGLMMGPFLTVLWEDLADPIQSGREELGFSKVYAELPDPRESGGAIHFAASWMGFTFLDMRLEDMEPVPLDAVPAAPPTESDVDLGLLHYKYMPRTGEWGTADASYPVLTPAANPNVTVTGVLHGKGTVAFHEARWEDMPTQYMIVNAFAELEVKEYRGAVMRHYHGSKDLSDQRILR